MRALLIATLVLAACGGTSPVPAGGPAQPPAPAVGALAPFPYTPDELRAGLPVGRTLRYEMVDHGHAGTIESVMRDSAGQAVGAPKRDTTKWTDLVAHASYPAATTTIEDVSLDTPSGKHPTKKYVVRRPDEKGRPSVTIAYFDLERPGPPVKMLVEVDGVIVQQLNLVGDQVTP